MSHRIAYQHAAVRLPLAMFAGLDGARTAGIYSDQVIVFELAGSNNIIEANGRGARDWSTLCYGMEWEAMRRAVEVAANCEGGMLKLNGEETKAEIYISTIRSLIADAAEPGRAPGQPEIVHGLIDIANADIAGFLDYEHTRLTELSEKHKAARTGGARPGRRWTFNLLDPAGYASFKDFRSLSMRRADGSFVSPAPWEQVKPVFRS